MKKDSITVIDVCGVKFELREREAKVVHDGDTNFGEIHPVEGLIYLNGKMPSEIRAITLIHEWIHGVFQNFGLEHTEAQVNVLSSELFRTGYRVKTSIMPPKGFLKAGKV